MTFEPAPLSDREVELLVQLAADPYDPRVSNLFAYSGACTAAGLMTRLAAAEPEERAMLIMAIRKAIGSEGEEEAVRCISRRSRSARFR